MIDDTPTSALPASGLSAPTSAVEADGTTAAVTSATVAALGAVCTYVLYLGYVYLYFYPLPDAGGL